MFDFFFSNTSIYNGYLAEKCSSMWFRDASAMPTLGWALVLQQMQVVVWKRNDMVYLGLTKYEEQCAKVMQSRSNGLQNCTNYCWSAATGKYLSLGCFDNM